MWSSLYARPWPQCLRRIGLQRRPNPVLTISLSCGPRSRGYQPVGVLQPLDDRHVGHAAAFAHGLQAVALVVLLERIDQRGHQLGAGAAERMAERDRAAVDVEPRRVGAGGLQPATGTAAKASLTSNRSMSSIFMPAFSSARLVACSGASSMITGSPPIMVM